MNSVRLFILLAVFVVVIWLGSLWYIFHGQVETLSNVGNAMAITGVLFSRLGFVALVGTVWLQRRQVDSAIQSMKDASEAQRENLELLRAQSEAMRAAAQINALSILIPLKQQQLDVLRDQQGRGRRDDVNAQLPTLEQAQINRIAQLETLVAKFRSDVQL